MVEQSFLCLKRRLIIRGGQRNQRFIKTLYIMSIIYTSSKNMLTHQYMYITRDRSVQMKHNHLKLKHSHLNLKHKKKVLTQSQKYTFDYSRKFGYNIGVSLPIKAVQLTGGMHDETKIKAGLELYNTAKISV